MYKKTTKKEYETPFLNSFTIQGERIICNSITSKNESFDDPEDFNW